VRNRPDGKTHPYMVFGMKRSKNIRFNSFIFLGQRALAMVATLALVWSAFPVGTASARKASGTRQLSEDQRILHVLNRLGFGARPGDVERVRKMGLDHYIDEQLHPEKIDDSVVEAKLQNLPTLSMTTAELYAKYPQPAQLVRQLQKRGDLPPDLAQLQKERADGNGAANQSTGPNTNGDQGSATANTSPGTPAQTGTDAAKGNATAGDQNKAFRQAIRDYYAQNNLQLPERIIAELQASRILRAVYSERQLQEVMVDFWTNHFNVFSGKGADKWLLTSYDRDTIRPNALGNFHDLLVATAESPAMLFYLDNFQSVSPNAPQGGRPNQPRRTVLGNPRLGGPFPGVRVRGGVFGGNRPIFGQPGAPQPAKQQQKSQPKRGINENYARELMELHTLGVDGGYTQKDVQEVARCFTGWTIRLPRGGNGSDADAGKFFFNARLHDNGEKTVLGHKIPAGGGMNDGLMVLDILAHHPSTAKFISTKLCRALVNDSPSPALVARVAEAFTKSSGDIRETLRAIFTSPEFNAPETYRAKTKAPFELAVSSIRALGGDTNGAAGLHQWIAKMGEPLYGYLTPNGYPNTAEAWVNTGSLLERLNFALALVSNRIPGTHVDLARFTGEAMANGAGALDKERVVDQFASVILQGDISAKTKQVLLRQLNEAAAKPAAPRTSSSTEPEQEATAPRNMRGPRREMARAGVGNPQVAEIAALVLGSPEFQQQ